MTLPAAPWPTFHSLIRAFFASNSGSLAIREGRYSLTYYERASFALAEAAKRAQGLSGKVSLDVWLPGYFCHQSSAPLRRMKSVQIKYYPIDENLIPDWKYLEEQGWKGELKDSLMVLVHYFGFPSETAVAEKICEKYGAYLLEDAAHALSLTEGMGHGDWAVLSPKKIMALPFGGILADGSAASAGTDTFGKMDGLFLVFKWAFRRLAQRGLVGMGVPWHWAWFSRPPDISAEPLPIFDKNGRMDRGGYAARLLVAEKSQEGRIAAARRENYVRLKHWVDGLSWCRPLFPELAAAVCPYAFPLLVKHQAVSVVRYLRSRGIPAGQWPDLPPEVLADPSRHGVALAMHDRLVLVPIHQSLSGGHIDWMGEKIRGLRN